MSKIVKNIALGLMVSALAPSSSQAADFFLKKVQGFENANVTRREAEIISSNHGVVKLQAQKAELDVSKPEEIRELVNAIKNARPQDRPTEIYDNATVVGPIVDANYGGVPSKEYFYGLDEAEQIRLKQEVKFVRSLQLGLDADVAETFREIDNNEHLLKEKFNPDLFTLALKEKKDGNVLNPDVLLPRVELSKSGCRDNSAEALASLGHIDADNLTHVKFADGQAGYVGGDKNLNIETLAALAKMTVPNNDPTQEHFRLVRDVVDATNKANDTKTMPPISVTGGLAGIALHLAPQRAELENEEFFKLVWAYNYLVNCIGIAAENLDENPAIIQAFEESSQKLMRSIFIKKEAANYFDLVDRNIAAAAIQLQLNPALAGKADADGVTFEDLQVVAENFRRVQEIRIGNEAGIGFDETGVALVRKLMVDFKKKPGDFNDRHVAAVAEHTNVEHLLHIADVSWEQIDASANLRAEGVAATVANVNASLYFAGLKNADGLGIDPVNADQIAAVVAMQDAAFVGGPIDNPTCQEVIEAVRMTDEGIPLSQDNVFTSVFLQYGRPEGGEQIIADPDQRDIEACLEIFHDTRTLGIQGSEDNPLVIAAVKHLKTIPALADVYTVDQIKATAMLQMQLDEADNGGVPEPVGFNPSEAQIAAVVGTPEEAQTLVSWKMQKEEEAGNHNFIPGAVLRFVRDDDGTGHAEFEVVHVLRADLTAAPARIVDHKIKVDPATLAGLTDGRNGVAAPDIGQLFVVSDLDDDGDHAARVTLDNPDRMPS